MLRSTKRISRKIGLAPGTLTHIGEKKTETSAISIINYNKERFHEKIPNKVEECFSHKDSTTLSWINVNGLHEVDIIEKIGNQFGLHPLILEDILNTGQRPKYEDFENYICIVLKMLYVDEKTSDIHAEQVSIVFGKTFVISFQEQAGDVFNGIRERIRQDKGKVRKMGADYLAYALIDAIVDHYFLILERLGENIEDVEEELVANPTPRNLRAIQNLKRDAIFLRKSVWPLREMINSMQRVETGLVKKTTGVYLRDLYDHIIQVIDTIETMRDMISGILDIYLSSISNRMNEVMKVLTIIATIFIPITFITGIYGMNFNPGISQLNMPELNWKFGYIFAWAAMILIVVSMLSYFRKKKWI